MRRRALSYFSSLPVAPLQRLEHVNSLLTLPELCVTLLPSSSSARCSHPLPSMCCCCLCRIHGLELEHLHRQPDAALHQQQHGAVGVRCLLPSHRRHHGRHQHERRPRSAQLLDPSRHLDRHRDRHYTLSRPQYDARHLLFRMRCSTDMPILLQSSRWRSRPRTRRCRTTMSFSG